MKKRLLGFVACVCLLLGISASAFGSTTQTNVLISKSYLEGTFFRQLQVLAEQRVKAADASETAVYLENLGIVGNAYVERLKVDESADIQWVTAGGFKRQTGENDDILILAEGAGLVWESGIANLSKGKLVDVTVGCEVAQGALEVGHRYIAVEETTLVVAGSSAEWSVEGQWHTTAEDATLPKPDPEFELTFTDVLESDWYYKAVCYVVEKGLFNGMSETSFAPNATMNRAMLATVIYRMSGSPKVVYNPVFSDVPDGEWYSLAIVWAAQNGIVNGMGNGEYQPRADLTRQQIAVLLHNYAVWLGIDTSAKADLSMVADGSKVSSWALEEMSWAVAVGLFQGDTAGNLNPGNSATRAAVATLLQRFDALCN